MESALAVVVVDEATESTITLEPGAAAGEGEEEDEEEEEEEEELTL